MGGRAGRGGRLACERCHVVHCMVPCILGSIGQGWAASDSVGQPWAALGSLGEHSMTVRLDDCWAARHVQMDGVS